MSLSYWEGGKHSLEEQHGSVCTERGNMVVAPGGFCPAPSPAPSPAPAAQEELQKVHRDLLSRLIHVPAPKCQCLSEPHIPGEARATRPSRAALCPHGLNVTNMATHITRGGNQRPACLDYRGCPRNTANSWSKHVTSSTGRISTKRRTHSTLHNAMRCPCLMSLHTSLLRPPQPEGKNRTGKERGF